MRRLIHHQSYHKDENHGNGKPAKHSTISSRACWSVNEAHRHRASGIPGDDSQSEETFLTDRYFPFRLFLTALRHVSQMMQEVRCLQ